MLILRILMGTVLLFAGRKLYWLFIAVVGFIAGFLLTNSLVPQSSTWLLILIGLIIGSLCALLAIFLNRLAVALVGFFGGGLLATQLLAYFEVGSGDFTWISFIVGGIIGIILAVFLFDWALIVFSSLFGAILIGTAWDNPSALINLFLLVLFLVGIGIQAGLMYRQRKLTS
ncbi:MAG: DUF4203 domain-containing protein [Anaerolineales bacterium]